MFNQPLGWDVSSVTSLYMTFYVRRHHRPPTHILRRPRAITSIPPRRHNTHTPHAWQSAKGFNQPLTWNTSAVSSLRETFAYAWAFNQQLDWDTSSVTTLQAIFYVRAPWLLPHPPCLVPSVVSPR